MLEGTAFVPPIDTGGTGCLSMLATVAVGGGSRQRRVGEGHLGGGSDSVNAFLQFYFKFLAKPQKPWGFTVRMFAAPWGAAVTFNRKAQIAVVFMAIPRIIFRDSGLNRHRLPVNRESDRSQSGRIAVSTLPYEDQWGQRAGTARRIRRPPA